MRKFKWITYFLIAALLVPNIHVFADRTCGIWLNETFNNYVTNTVPAFLSVSDGGIARVVNDGNNNKAFMIGNKYTASKISVEYAATGYKYIVSADFRSDQNPVSFEFGLANKTITDMLVSVKDNVICAANNKQLGRLASSYTNIAIAVDAKHSVYSVYVNGGCVLELGDLPRTDYSSAVINKTGLADSGKMYMDNVRIYAGNEIRSGFGTHAYNNKETAYADIDYSAGDHAFFHSDYLSDVTNTYYNATLAPKTNKITANRLDRFNAQRTDNSIVFEKTTTSDCHMDIQLDKSYYYHTLRRFPYYLIRSKMKIDKIGANAYPAYIRQELAGGSRYEDYIFRINTSGQLVTKTGAVIKNIVPGEWFEFAVAFDMENHKADLYIDNVLEAEGIAFNSSIDELTMVRLWLQPGPNGDMSVDEYEVLGTKKPYQIDDSNRSSVFDSDDSIKEYLKGKTAFHAYSGIVAVDGEKYSPEIKPVWNKELQELFVSPEMLLRGYGIETQLDAAAQKLVGDGIEITAGMADVVYNGGRYQLDVLPIFEENTVLVPVKEFASKVLQYCVHDDGSGMILTSAEQFGLDMEDETPEYAIGDAVYPHSAVKSINWYLFFERPSAETIQNNFNAKTNNGVQHPRILASSEEFAAIKEARKTDEVLNKWVEKAISSADSILKSEPVAYVIVNKVRILESAQELLRRMENLGFAYQLTGDKKYADKAWEEFQHCGTWPDWCPSHMIDVGELNAAYAIGYDWMYDAFTEEQRAYIYNTAKNMGMLPTQAAYYGRLAGGHQNASCSDLFVKWKSNFNTIINGGAIAAAMAFAEREPELCFDIAEKAVRSLEYTMLGFQPDGAWVEGAGYWNYTMSYLSKGVGALISATGTDYGIMDFEGVENTGMFLISMDSPQGMNNFHDAGDNGGRQMSSQLAWLGKLYNNPSYFAARKNYIETYSLNSSIYDILWYWMDCPVTVDDAPLDWYSKGIESFSMRESYSDTEGMYVSAHGGMVLCYHSQADVGSFIYDVLGKRWAADLGKEDYTVQRVGGGGYYAAYRRRAESHNVIVFNPDTSGGMNDDGFAEMIDFTSKSKGAYAVYDMADVYCDYVQSYKRGYYVGDNRRSLTVRDEFTANDEMPFYWFMTTPAEVEIVDSNTAILTQGNAQVKLEIITNAKNAELTFGAAQPLPSSPVLADQNTNEGYTRISFYAEAGKNENITVTAKLSPVGESAAETGVMDIPLSSWSVEDGERAPRENLSLKAVYVNGRNIAQFSAGDTIKVMEGQPVPEVYAEAVDASKSVEVLQAEALGDDTVIRIYNSAQDRYRQYIISYEVLPLPFDPKVYEKHEIKEISVSSEPQPENHRMNMIDYDMSTRWTAMEAGSWAVFDLGEVKQLDGIGIAFWQGDKRNYKYELYISSDQENWTQVYHGASSGKSEAMEIIDVAGRNARYIKFVGNGNSVNINSNILEFAALKKIQ